MKQRHQTWSIYSTLIIALLLLLKTQPAQAAENLSDVTNSLMCTCGCTMVLYSCQCGTADQMKAKIQQMINDGKTKPEILKTFVSQYGQKILAAPPKEGFNLSVWVLPFAALAVAAVMLYFLLKSWSARGAKAEKQWQQKDLSKDEQALIDRELHKRED